MKAVQDFNYKVALSSGLKQLQAGKLRQAEEQFRYLVAKFPGADGGHRGLARVYIELGDRNAAVATLRDGAAAIARAGDRAIAIEVLREAVRLDALDLVAHRRLAAALALNGDADSAAAEYARSVEALLSTGDRERARLEVEYALSSLGQTAELTQLAAKLGIAIPEKAAADGRIEEAMSEETAAEIPAPAADLPTDALSLEERATNLLASGDRGAETVAIAAAAALREEGKLDAASDLLLGLISRGIAVHAAERELVAVARALGREDLASERSALLEQVGRLG